MRFLTRSHILGVGSTALGKLNKSASALMREAVEAALADANVRLRQLDGVVAVPSLSEPRFMEAHYLATRLGLLPKKAVTCRTLDTGGASPISALLEADKLIRMHGCDLVAVVAGDAVSSMPTEEFLRRADFGCADPDGSSQSPVIPNGYDRVARWQIASGRVTREQLAMVSVLMSRQAARHPLALTKRPHTLREVLDARSVAPVTTLLECARRADGGAAVIVCSTRFLAESGALERDCPVILAGGEASGPLYPPAVIDEEMFSCEQAATQAYNAAQLGPADISYWGLYDCYPICFVRAVEAVGLAERGRGGAWVQERYEESERDPEKRVDPSRLPCNTHGGLLSFGAPWEVPALYSIIEAVAQLKGTAASRQVGDVRRALVYGNGGIFSASAVVILGRGESYGASAPWAGGWKSSRRPRTSPF